MCGEAPELQGKGMCQLCADSTCEKCGGETGMRMSEDESYNYCSDCGWITH
jgi:hypothetical protein